ncbi:branched-chain amino acid ABC transporter permease [Nocardioides sp. Kera G14]|uniref:branched-chain amino acid ABC transporter permease n=1 Tax=Nocardioides sp. Kera G14 TaxID=2884264 RepID=UPI001D10054F|nr:branched-chain amino acid ABC transporter permease [Nocardioides sp. Kera G14]UDY22434.1 branched-chain amino acid ABC transporter permease [Nocardioides sp. Kera G14]
MAIDFKSIDKSKVGWPLGFGIAAVVVFVFYSFILPNLGDDVGTFFQDWLPLDQINLALIWAMSALGLNIVVGYAGLLDLGYVAFWAFGGYSTAWFMSSFIPTHKAIDVLGNLSPGTEQGVHLNVVLVAVIAVALCAAFGVLIGAPTLRLRGDYLALVTMGFGEITAQFFTNSDNIFGHNIGNGSLGIGPTDNVSGVKVTDSTLSWGNLLAFDHQGRFIYFALLTGIIIFISLRIRSGRLGRAWLALREDELAASAMGVSLVKTKLSAYAVGAAAGGLCGVAYAMQLGRLLPDPFTFSVSITLLAMVVLGGMGNVWGVLIGALFLSWFNSTGLGQIGDTINNAAGTSIDFSSYTFLIFGGALVLMMLFRREGFFPESRTRAVMHEGAVGDTFAEAPSDEIVEQAEAKAEESSL